MTHIVFLVMMTTANGVPRQMAAEATMEKCMTDVQQSAVAGTGRLRTFWYCQPAVAPAKLGPRS